MVVVGVVGLREAHQISPLVWPVGQEVVVVELPALKKKH
jgi:hypothetical protein